jgi:hypothetical protein
MPTAAAVALISTGVSIQQGRQSAKAQRKASDAQQRIADAQTAREKRGQVREARIRRAEVISQAEATGASGSSGEMGATSSIQSQLGSNLGHLNYVQGQAQYASRQLQQAAKFQSNAATAQAIGNVAGQAAGPDGFKNLWKNMTT